MRHRVAPDHSEKNESVITRGIPRRYGNLKALCGKSRSLASGASTMGYAKYSEIVYSRPFLYPSAARALSSLFEPGICQREVPANSQWRSGYLVKTEGTTPSQRLLVNMSMGPLHLHKMWTQIVHFLPQILL